LERGRLKRSRRCRADGDDPPSFTERAINRSSRSIAYRVKLRLYPVIFYALDPHRLKSPVPDVQGYFRRLDSACSKFFKQPFGEMEPGRGRGHRSALARENGLVPFGVEAVLFIALYVWRQRRPPDPINDLVKAAFAVKANYAPAELVPFDDFGRKSPAREFDLSARKQRFARANERFPHERLKAANQKDLNAPAQYLLAARGGPDPAADQARGKYSRIIQHEQIARSQELGQLSKYRVGEPVACAINDQQSRLIAARGRFLRDQLVGEMIIEIGNEHIMIFTRRCRTPGLPHYRLLMGGCRFQVSYMTLQAGGRDAAAP
jgi:hypothetical protein